MPIAVRQAELREIAPLRDIYRQEMNCRIIHDSVHSRPGWTLEYLVLEDGAGIGYGSVAVAGPWKDKPTVYEYYILPQFRSRIRPSNSSSRRPVPCKAANNADT